MPKSTPEEVRAKMSEIKEVRNVGMVGSSGIGKSCVVDCLGVMAGLVGEDKVGTALISHIRQDERDKACSYKSNVNSMMLTENLLANVVDSPGHVDFSAELNTSMPIIDGAVFIVNASEQGGGILSSNRQIKDLIAWNIEPILFCNKLDVSLLVMQKTADEIVDFLSSAVDNFNMCIDSGSANAAHTLTKAAPETGNVIFGSAAQGWAFNIPQLAAMYSKKFGYEVEKMAEKMWGEHYYDPKGKKWTSSATEGTVLGFVQFVLDPIMKVMSMCEAGEMAKLEKMMTAVNVSLTAADKSLTGKLLFKRCMQLWMPAGRCFAQAFQKFVPDPVAAQVKRFPVLACGPADDATTLAVKACDPKGPLIFQVVKLVPQPSGRFHALGRVFSGTIAAEKYFLLDDDYLPPHAQQAAPAEEAANAPAPTVAADAEGDAQEASKEDGEGEKGEAEKGGGAPMPKNLGAKKSGVQEGRVQSVMICSGKATTATPGIPAGNICMVGGIDQLVLKRTTVVSTKDSFPLFPPKFTASPVVRMSVAPKDAKELPKMVEGLKRLSKSCPIVEIKLEDSGSHVVAGVGSEHMRLLANDLKEYTGNISMTWGAPSVAYRETVTELSSKTCLSKSANKHNRLFVKAEPLGEGVCRAIESGRIFPEQSQKNRAKILEKEFDWDKVDSMKVWGFGPAPEVSGSSYGANLVIDQTKGVQYMNEIRESVNSGLLWASKSGPICDEEMRGIRFNILDVKLHADTIHRGSGQIMPTARRVFYAALMTGQARLVEPVFLSQIDSPADCSPGVLQALNGCRGELISSEEQGSSISFQVYVPVSETIGQTPFATVLSQKTNGKAIATYEFDHWETMPSDPLAFDPKTKKPTSKSAEVMLNIRIRKQLKPEPPNLDDYLDKL